MNSNYEKPTLSFGEEQAPQPRCLAVGAVVFIAIAGVIWNVGAVWNWAGVAVAAAAAGVYIKGVGIDC